MIRIRQLFADPLKVNATLILVAFGSVFVLTAQSASAIFTYLLGLLMLLQYRRWRGYLSDPTIIISGVLLSYLVLSSSWSETDEPEKVTSMAVRALSAWLFLIAYVESWRAGYLQRWFGKTLVAGCGFAAAIALGYFFVTSPEDGRLNGLGQLGAHVIAGLIFGVGFIYLLQTLREDRSRRWRLIGVLCGLLMLIAIVLTFSRNAWFSGLAGVVVYLTATRWLNRKQLVIGICSIGLLVLLLLTSTFFSEEARDLLLPRGDSFRPLIWTTVFERVWSDGLLFGMGILTPDDVVNGEFVHPHPHNMYLAVLYQGGLIGLGLFLSLIVQVLRSLLARLELPEARVALAVLTVGLLSYLLDGHELVDRIGETWLLFWLPVAVSVSLRFRPQIQAP